MVLTNGALPRQAANAFDVVLPADQNIEFQQNLATLPLAASTVPSEYHTLAEVAKRVPKGIVCLLTALRFHAIGTQHPREVWLAVDRRAGVPWLDARRFASCACQVWR